MNFINLQGGIVIDGLFGVQLLNQLHTAAPPQNFLTQTLHENKMVGQ